MPQLAANWPDKLQQVRGKFSLIKVEALMLGDKLQASNVQQKRLSERTLTISMVAERCDSPILLETRGRKSLNQLLAKDFSKIYFDQYKQLPMMVPDLFNVMKADGAYEKTSSAGQVPDFVEFTGNVAKVSPTQEYDKTYTFTEFAAKIEIQRKLAAKYIVGRFKSDELLETLKVGNQQPSWVKTQKVQRLLVDSALSLITRLSVRLSCLRDDIVQYLSKDKKRYLDDQYRVMSRYPKSLATSAGRSREKMGAQVFGLAFTFAPTDGDAVALCSTAHPSNVAGVASQSNSGTLALSATNVETTRQNMAAFKDDIGEIVSIQLDTLLVPRALEQTGWEIINSKGKVDTANNNANFHQGKYKLAVWDRLNIYGYVFHLN